MPHLDLFRGLEVRANDGGVDDRTFVVFVIEFERLGRKREAPDPSLRPVVEPVVDALPRTDLSGRSRHGMPVFARESTALMKARSRSSASGRAVSSPNGLELGSLLVGKGVASHPDRRSRASLPSNRRRSVIEMIQLFWDGIEDIP